MIFARNWTKLIQFWLKNIVVQYKGNQIPWIFFHLDPLYQESSISPTLTNDDNERRDEVDLEKAALTGAPTGMISDQNRNGKCFYLFKNIRNGVIILPVSMKQNLISNYLKYR